MTHLNKYLVLIAIVCTGFVSGQENTAPDPWVGEWVSRLNGCLWTAYADGRMEYETPVKNKSKRGKGSWKKVGDTIEVDWEKIGIDIVTVSQDGRTGHIVVKKKPDMKYKIRRLK